ncbi:LysM peptidoglycan-binding domain-containing protein [Actinomadura craniellae]|uniref:LysM peptidoglycan-binding domain-containing protein n=1 Tax=Actinomadura craniellae TaxID=2231787 RepID=A0A365GVM8_9ACTN|nr:LysM peptidoglycan-binding domain-containing protein [Actinomadura craniellae]
MRLTRRGRVVLVAAVAALLVVAFWLTAGRGARAGDDVRQGPPTGVRTVVVDGDDTLWAIAARARPNRDPRVTVHLIRELNGLSGSIIRPGQRLIVPR